MHYFFLSVHVKGCNFPRVLIPLLLFFKKKKKKDDEKLIAAVQSQTFIYDKFDRNDLCQISHKLIQQVLKCSRLHLEVLYELLWILKQILHARFTFCEFCAQNICG